MTTATATVPAAAITLDFTPVVAVCFPVTDGKPVAAEYKLTMTSAGAAIATGTYPSASFTQVTGAKALVTSVVAALSAVYMM